MRQFPVLVVAAALATVTTVGVATIAARHYLGSTAATTTASAAPELTTGTIEQRWGLHRRQHDANRLRVPAGWRSPCAARRRVMACVGSGLSVRRGTRMGSSATVRRSSPCCENRSSFQLGVPIVDQRLVARLLEPDVCRHCPDCKRVEKL